MYIQVHHITRLSLLFDNKRDRQEETVWWQNVLYLRAVKYSTPHGKSSPQDSVGSDISKWCQFRKGPTFPCINHYEPPLGWGHGCPHPSGRRPVGRPMEGRRGEKPPWLIRWELGDTNTRQAALEPIGIGGQDPIWVAELLPELIFLPFNSISSSASKGIQSNCDAICVSCMFSLLLFLLLLDIAEILLVDAMILINQPVTNIKVIIWQSVALVG